MAFGGGGVLPEARVLQEAPPVPAIRVVRSRVCRGRSRCRAPRRAGSLCRGLALPVSVRWRCRCRGGVGVRRLVLGRVGGRLTVCPAPLGLGRRRRVGGVGPRRGDGRRRRHDDCGVGDGGGHGGRLRPDGRGSALLPEEAGRIGGDDRHCGQSGDGDRGGRLQARSAGEEALERAQERDEVEGVQRLEAAALAGVLERVGQRAAGAEDERLGGRVADLQALRDLPVGKALPLPEQNRLALSLRRLRSASVRPTSESYERSGAATVSSSTATSPTRSRPSRRRAERSRVKHTFRAICRSHADPARGRVPLPRLRQAFRYVACSASSASSGERRSRRQ